MASAKGTFDGLEAVNLHRVRQRTAGGGQAAEVQWRSAGLAAGKLQRAVRTVGDLAAWRRATVH